jgi:hypothetical protein
MGALVSRIWHLKSVSAVFTTLAGGTEDAASKPAFASLLASIWNELTRGSIGTIPASEETTNTQRFEEDVSNWHLIVSSMNGDPV